MSRFTEGFAACVRENGLNVFRMTEIKDGVSETVEFTETNRCQDSYSVAKAFTVAAVGCCFDDGALSTDERIADIFPEYRVCMADERWRDATLHHALKHTLGVPGGCLDIDALPAGSFSDDFLKYLFSLPLNNAPGEERAYSDGAFYLLGRAVEKKAGEPLDRFLWKRLFSPMDFAEAAWSACPQGHPMGATGLYLHSSDMAKLGQLFLQRGEYAGKRLLSEEWVDTVLEREYEFAWNPEKTAYGKGGMFGQSLTVIPGQNRVVAWHAYLTDKSTGPIFEYMQNFA